MHLNRVRFAVTNETTEAISTEGIFEIPTTEEEVVGDTRTILGGRKANLNYQVEKFLNYDLCFIFTVVTSNSLHCR